MKIADAPDDIPPGIAIDQPRDRGDPVVAAIAVDEPVEPARGTRDDVPSRPAVDLVLRAVAGMDDIVPRPALEEIAATGPAVDP